MNWKTKVLIMGGVLGALLGLGAALIYIREAEASMAATQTPPRVRPGEAVRLGVTLMDILRQVASIGAKDT